MSPVVGAIATVFAGAFILCLLLVFIRHEIDAFRWRAWCRAVGDERTALRMMRERIERDAETDSMIEAGFRELDRIKAPVLPFRPRATPRNHTKRI